jgi:hypothetical protein
MGVVLSFIRFFDYFRYVFLIIGNVKSGFFCFICLFPLSALVNGVPPSLLGQSEAEQ